jgi:hypothetical protein
MTLIFKKRKNYILIMLLKKHVTMSFFWEKLYLLLQIYSKIAMYSKTLKSCN